MLNDDDYVYKWFFSFKKVGIVRFIGVVDKCGEIIKFGKRIGFLYFIFYG